MTRARSTIWDDCHYVTIPQTAKRLTVSEQSVRRMTNDGTLPVYDLGGAGGIKRLLRTDVEAYEQKSIREIFPRVRKQRAVRA